MRRTPGRRPLRFASVEEIPADLQRIAAGHRTMGRWSFAQICHHLAFAIDATIDGFPTRPFPWFLRATAGRWILKRMFADERIVEGVWLPRNLHPDPALDQQAELAHLQQAIQRFLNTPEPQGFHPFFGKLTPAEWHHYHCIHCAHHLSFAVPTLSPTPQS